MLLGCANIVLLGGFMTFSMFAFSMFEERRNEIRYFLLCGAKHFSPYLYHK